MIKHICPALDVYSTYTDARQFITTDTGFTVDDLYDLRDLDRHLSEA